MQSGPDPEVITGIIAAYAVVILIAMLVGLFVVALQIFCWWRIFTRTGSHGALSLLLLVPFGKVIVLLIAAFGNWPVLDELQALRYRGSSGPPPQALNPPRAG